MAGGTGIEPATCGFGESGIAFFPVLSRLSRRVRPEFKPFLVSSRLRTSAPPAVKCAVNLTQPSALSISTRQRVCAAKSDPATVASTLRTRVIYFLGNCFYSPGPSQTTSRHG